MGQFDGVGDRFGIVWIGTWQGMYGAKFLAVGIAH